MIININCIDNYDGVFCNNKKIKRSLFGLRARHCIDYPYDKGCKIRHKYVKPVYCPTMKENKNAK